jgi:hypothetical protein
MSEARRRIFGRGAEGWPQFGICLLTLYAIVRTIVAAHIRPFWFDEILTWIMSHQPDVAAIWSGIRQVVDGQPILFYLIERAFNVLPNTEIALRLPSVAGFACVLICLFVFVRRRSGAVYGLVSAAVAMLTSLYMPYAIEARPYSLVAACIAVALVAYQRASQLRWAALLAFALAMAECLHYYSVFALIPFAAAEAALSWQMLKIRWSIWTALAIGALPLAVFWPILAHIRAVLGGNSWLWPGLSDLVHVYGGFLNISWYLGLPVAILCGLALVGALSPASSRVLPLGRRELANEAGDNFWHERVLIAFLLAVPLLVIVATRLLHGGFVDRYVLYAVLGVPLTVGLLLPRLGRRALILFSALLVCSIAMQEASFWFFSQQPLWSFESPAEDAGSLIRDAGHTDLPVVIADSFDYPILDFYAPDSLARRLVTVTSAPSWRPGSADQAVSLMATYYPFKVYDFPAWRSTHPSFLLYSSFGDLKDWWANNLVQNNYDLRPVASNDDHVVFLVSSPETRVH